MNEFEIKRKKIDSVYMTTIVLQYIALLITCIIGWHMLEEYENIWLLILLPFHAGLILLTILFQNIRHKKILKS